MKCFFNDKLEIFLVIFEGKFFFEIFYLISNSVFGIFQPISKVTDFMKIFGNYTMSRGNIGK